MTNFGYMCNFTEFGYLLLGFEAITKICVCKEVQLDAWKKLYRVLGMCKMFRDMDQ